MLGEESNGSQFAMAVLLAGLVSHGIHVLPGRLFDRLVQSESNLCLLRPDIAAYVAGANKDLNKGKHRSKILLLQPAKVIC